jgi:hypothetical protein
MQHRIAKKFLQQALHTARRCNFFSARRCKVES